MILHWSEDFLGGCAKNYPFGSRNFSGACHPHVQCLFDRGVFLLHGRGCRSYFLPYPTEIGRCVENERYPTLRQCLNSPPKRAVEGRRGGLAQVPGKKSEYGIARANIEATSEERRFFALGVWSSISPQFTVAIRNQCQTANKGCKHVRPSML